MEIVKGFFDYCISDECITNGDFKKLGKRLLELGYRTIAINQTIDESNTEPKKKKKKGEIREINDPVLVPIDVKLDEELEQLKVLNRLTVTFSNQDFMHKVTKSPNYKKYHIIAVSPTNQGAFQYVCNNLEADILTFNAESKVLYKISRKLYNQLINRRYYFEILYTPAIIDTTKRKNIIHMSHLYHSFGKSKNLIISSGASNETLIRSPYDIINLGLIFGLNEQQAKQAITYHCKKLFLNSVGRRHGRAVMIIENVVKDEEMNVDAEDDKGEEMELDQPLSKKSKQ